MGHISFRRSGLLCAASALAFAATPAAAQQARPTGSEESPAIIINDSLATNLPAPAGSLDTGVTGVGQMIAFVQTTSPTSASLSLCTGTLINPRTVIFAAHCVNTRPAHVYGSNTGTGGGTFGAFGTTQGLPLSFGFSATNRCLGVAVNGCAVGEGGYEAWRDSVFQTQAHRNLFNVNQVWWDPRSQNPGSSGFLMGDVAIATLDTPAFDIPTWAMLFSPLEGPTESRIIGYGVNNTQAGAQGPGPCTTASCSALGSIDYRRRAATNIISVLGSLDDRNQWLFGSAGTVNNVYMQSFSDPSGVYNPAAGFYDFGVFGGPSLGDVSLPNEGITAGGDSGGPLVVDQYERSVVVGVLSGGSRFFGGQRFSTYGTHNFYQPLHAYWDAIVANNPYVYAGNIVGNGDWEDPSHWVQLMDPNYMILQNGELVNGLPDTPAEGVTGTGAKFGYICFLGDCVELDQEAPTGDGNAIYILGGPGTMNFVPNNVEPVNSADPNLHIRARYYDVILSAPGRTTLSSAVEIDRMTLNGQTQLRVNDTGSLSVLGEYNQIQGWTNVDGSIESGRDMFILTGMLSGKGTVVSPFLTVVGGIVAPGSITPSGVSHTGTLTVDGNVILASESTVMFELTRNNWDRLNVTGELILDGGTAWFGPGLGAAPRHNQSFVVASAADGVDGTFGDVVGSVGVLSPSLTYGANDVSVKLQAGSLAAHLGSGTPTALAFANALDALRANNYNSLWNLYGSIDLMSSGQLSGALSALSPRIVGDVGTFHDHQSKLLTTTVTDRLSLIGSGQASGLTVTGSPMAGIAAQNGLGEVAFGFGGTSTSSTSIDSLPGKLSGFVSGGVERTRSSYGEQAYAAGQGAWHMAMGLEMPVGEGMIGTAAGYAEGASSPSGDNNRSRTTMAAAYAATPLGGGFYVGGMFSAETARASMERTAHDGVSILRLTGATSAERYSAIAEAGRVTQIGSGLTLTPRAQLAYGRYKLEGFEERGGETALQLEDVKVTRIEARLGTKLEGSTSFAGFTVKPQISADYVNLLSGRNMGAIVRFAAAPDEAFALPLATSASGWAEIKGGVTVEDGPMSFGISGQHSTGNADLSDQRAQAELKIRF